MSRRYITAAEQQQVIERASRRCEYCKSLMDYSSQSFVMEHIIPVAEAGETSPDNLALACGGCNAHKYAKVEVFDSVSQALLFTTLDNRYGESILVGVQTIFKSLG